MRNLTCLTFAVLISAGIVETSCCYSNLIPVTRFGKYIDSNDTAMDKAIPLQKQEDNISNQDYSFMQRIKKWPTRVKAVAYLSRVITGIVSLFTTQNISFFSEAFFEILKKKFVECIEILAQKTHSMFEKKENDFHYGAQQLNKEEITIEQELQHNIETQNGSQFQALIEDVSTNDESIGIHEQNIEQKDKKRGLFSIFKKQSRDIVK